MNTWDGPEYVGRVLARARMNQDRDTWEIIGDPVNGPLALAEPKRRVKTIVAGPLQNRKARRLGQALARKVKR